MAFSIKNDEADRLARELSALTGETLTETVVRSLRERLSRQRAGVKRPRAGTELARIGSELRRLPILDPRSPDELLGYDENGLPT
jgi:antitoxin VapB